MRKRTQLVDPKPEPAAEYDGPSKSQLKRDMTALQVLGRQITELSPERVAQLGLPERLHEEILAFRKISAHEGARRQMQLIGRLMRDVDPQPLREALERFNGASKAEIAAMHIAERWRDRLLASPEVLTEFANVHPGLDLTRMRTLLRNAAREKNEARPPRDFRELYRMIRAAMAGATQSSNAEEKP